MSRVFVLGNASIDTTLTVPRLPLPGETLVATGLLRAPGGKGLNQAVVAARAGAAGIDVHFCAPLGHEPGTAMIRAALATEGFSGLNLPQMGQPTDLSTLLVAPDGENCIISTGACAAALPVGTAVAFVASMSPRDILLVQGNLSAAATLAAVRRAPFAIFNAAPLRWPAGAVAAACAIVVANRLESAQLTGEADPLRAAARLGGAVGIVTLGAEGCLLAEGGGVRHLPAQRPVQVIDTTGAGDTFCGMLAAALARGLAMPAAIDAAQRAACLAVAQVGCFAALPDAAALGALLAAGTSSGEAGIA